MKYELEIDPADLDSQIEDHFEFVTGSFGQGFDPASPREAFERVLSEPFEDIAAQVHPVALPDLVASYHLVKQAARIGKALVDARDRELVAAG